MRLIGEACSALPPKARKEADVTLRDDLLNYMARNGRDAIAFERPDVVIIGEIHGYLKSK